MVKGDQQGNYNCPDKAMTNSLIISAYLRIYQNFKLQQQSYFITSPILQQ
ncbi:unnamed protein product [Paramecium sonneborni]|uniref:Uncharacterized protein n=1 Tax=Paramecium sonneborni TaxID=65129 RepID=A0A8S1MBQ0_9CILI|nr:unnamed protein product [Paramecium sonneborni]